MEFNQVLEIELDIGHFAFWGEYSLESLRSTGRSLHEIRSRAWVTTIDDSRNEGPVWTLRELSEMDPMVSQALECLIQCEAMRVITLSRSCTLQTPIEELRTISQTNARLLSDVIQVLGGQKWRNP